MRQGDALDLISAMTERPDLIVTDPPYAFGGSGDEHAISATVAVVLREAAARLARGRWMLVMCAASWRSTAYMVEAVRGVVEPVRIATWCKPQARTKTRTAGWLWSSVNVIAFRKGRAEETAPAEILDHITAPPRNGRAARGAAGGGGGLDGPAIRGPRRDHARPLRGLRRPPRRRSARRHDAARFRASATGRPACACGG